MKDKNLMSLMSSVELDRASILQRVVSGTLNRKSAAEALCITDRQLRRLLVVYKLEGASGLAHKGRGKPGNHTLNSDTKKKAIELVKLKYHDFGPTFASEKLKQYDSIDIGAESLRLLMIEGGLWKTKKRKATHRARRERRACYGEMEQFDGCRHDWFEGRLPDGEWATLLASRDDANNNVVAEFLDYEGTVPVMLFWKSYFPELGKPVSIYLDRHSTYKINAKSALDDTDMISQFERAMKQINVQVIHANSPQAKGRIENLFGTLQDRLVKELRLAGISDIVAANKFLKEVFLPEYNKRFSVAPRLSDNLHRPIEPGDNLDSVLSVQSDRAVNNDFTVRYKNTWLQLDKVQPRLVTAGAKVTVEERLDGSMHLRLKNDSNSRKETGSNTKTKTNYLNYKILNEKPIKLTKSSKPITALAGEQNPGEIIKARGITKPGPKHPWRGFKLLPYNVTNKYAQKIPSKKMS